MPRFVILTHDYPFLHWDFMLEREDCLTTWRLLQQPETDKVIVAERLADHRKMYLDYEGPVSNDRGEVRRWDGGQFQTLAESSDCVHVLLEGERLRAEVVIENDLESNQWSFRARSS